jgi:hypothetical protein
VSCGSRDGSAAGRAKSKRPAVKDRPDLPIEGQVPDRSFADVLEDTIRRMTAEVMPRPAQSWTAGAAAPAGAAFLFTRPLTAPIPRWPEAVFQRPPRRPHRLTAEQQKALRGFLSLGGVVADDFTAEELRRAYRRLAHRYHPDRHRDASPATRALLARQFAEATECYRCLAPAVGPRH